MAYTSVFCVLLQGNTKDKNMAKYPYEQRLF